MQDKIVCLPQYFQGRLGDKEMYKPWNNRVTELLLNLRKTSLICMYIWIPKAVIILQIPPLVFLDAVRYIEEKSTVLVGQKYNVTFK